MEGQADDSNDRGAWVCTGPFWVLIPRPASLLLAYTAHHTGRESRNEKWVDLIQIFKDVAAAFADGGSR